MSGAADWQSLLDVVLQASLDDMPPSDAPLWLEQAARLAASSIPDTAGCSLTVRDGGSWTTLAHSGGVAQQLDAEQFQLGWGPCLQAASDGQTVSLTSMSDQERFGEFGSIARDLGIESSLSVPVRPGDGRPAALNVYGTRNEAFAGADAQAVMTTLTTCVSTLLGGPDTDAAWRRMAARLQPALADRTAIGQAQGVLAVTTNISLDDAYAVLVERSRTDQEPLVAAARKVLSRLNNDADASSV
jgi:hypothetical protein